jgi:hypothetical protein
MLSPESCPHSLVEGNATRYLRTGDIQDRPGHECLLRRRGEACTPEWNDCARIERVKEMCPPPTASLTAKPFGFGMIQRPENCSAPGAARTFFLFWTEIWSGRE